MSESTESKRNRIAKTTMDEDNGTVSWEFSNGQTRSAAIDNFPAPIVNTFALFGVKQKLSNSYAGCKSVDEALEEYDTLMAQLVAGDWKAAREGSGGVKGGKTVTALFRICQSVGVPPILGELPEITKDTVRAAYVALPDEVKKAITASDLVRAEFAKMLQEESTSGVDLMSMSA